MAKTYPNVPGGISCRICRGIYADVEEDLPLHRAEHKRLAMGGLPRPVIEMMKSHGWAMAHNDGGMERLKANIDPELGKLAVAYAYWVRARALDCPLKDFDSFMIAHLAFADALVGGDTKAQAIADDGINRWERYAG